MPLQFLYSAQKGKSTMSAQVRAEQARETQRLQALHRRYSILDARDHITSIVHANYEEHLCDMIRVECDLTEVELRAIGRMSQMEGLKACCQLIRAPVIHEEVALTLWHQLASEQSRSTSDGSGESDEGAEQEALENQIRADMSGPCSPKKEKLAPKTSGSPSEKGLTWHRIKTRPLSVTSIVEAQEPEAQQPKCVMCSGVLELDCQVPSEFMKDYGTLPGRRESWPPQSSSSSGRRNSDLSKNTTSPNTSTKSTSSDKSVTSSTQTRLSLRRSLSYVAALAKRTPRTTTSLFSPTSQMIVPARRI